VDFVISDSLQFELCVFVIEFCSVGLFVCPFGQLSSTEYLRMWVKWKTMDSNEFHLSSGKSSYFP
jgi:hypothetical protein